MIVDNLTKFNQKKKIWMTPKHPLYAKAKEYKLMYGAACFMQAELSEKVSPLDNFELERLLLSGLRLEMEDIKLVFEQSKEKSRVIDFLLQNFETEREKYLILLDMINISMYHGQIAKRERESIELFGKMFCVSTDYILQFIEFLQSAEEETVSVCRELLHRMHLNGIDLSPADMKYYVMHFWGTMECNQELLDQQKDVRIIERCQISEDLVLRPGMRLVFDHAEVRIKGNILLNGGELVIEDSKVIRKGDSHRACINMKSVNSRVVIERSEMDCRNLGMLVRAEAGVLQVTDSMIYQTARGAAIRFWGQKIVVKNTIFSECYSPEDGGAIMIRTPDGVIEGCKFRRCEARQGGAVFAVEGNRIQDCRFDDCCVSEYGAAVFYHGFVRANVHHLQYKGCCPEGAETVQYLARMGTFQITGEYHIRVSTIIDCPVMVEAEGVLVVEDADLYLNYPIRCRGSLQMKNVKIISSHLQESDMVILEHSRGCRIHHCEFNGMQKTGGIYASGCRITITKSLFRNINGGRAIYDAYSPEIRECIFNYCQDGAVYCQNGEIKRSVFVNCRAKNGAGVQMYGGRGVIEQNNFRRCVADYSGGAVDRALGQQVIGCVYEDCKPNDVS
ncbi:MAG: right-handed parallel beta-helix repeat-containing protein [Clostridiaceae bacterium]|nr:right-handed parallel beta-helix repeat-containing protein [Clostridiaceae bacterium]